MLEGFLCMIKVNEKRCFMKLIVDEKAREYIKKKSHDRSIRVEGQVAGCG